MLFDQILKGIVLPDPLLIIVTLHKLLADGRLEIVGQLRFVRFLAHKFSNIITQKKKTHTSREIRYSILGGSVLDS